MQNRILNSLHNMYWQARVRGDSARQAATAAILHASAAFTLRADPGTLHEACETFLSEVW